jgi:hypothetical protein
VSVRVALVLASAVAVTVAVTVLASADDSGETGGSARSIPSSAPASAPGEGRDHPRGVRVRCRDRSEADFPGAFSDPDNMVIGPLVFVGGAATANDPPSLIREYDGQKLPLLVRAGHVVTVQIPEHKRDFARLAYGRDLPQGRVRLEDAHHTITFRACRRNQRSGSRAPAPVTFWSGFVMVREPGCVPLLAYVDDEPSPRRKVMSLGAGRCD